MSELEDTVDNSLLPQIGRMVIGFNVGLLANFMMGGEYNGLFDITYAPAILGYTQYLGAKYSGQNEKIPKEVGMQWASSVAAGQTLGMLIYKFS